MGSLTPKARYRFLADKGPLRDAKLKLIPSLAQGSWVVRQAVGQTPVILGKRLKTEYFKEDAYIEADVDISANATANGVTSLVAGAIKSLVFDIGIVLEVRSAADRRPSQMPQEHSPRNRPSAPYCLRKGVTIAGLPHTRARPTHLGKHETMHSVSPPQLLPPPHPPPTWSRFTAMYSTHPP